MTGCISTGQAHGSLSCMSFSGQAKLSGNFNHRDKEMQKAAKTHRMICSVRMKSENWDSSPIYMSPGAS